MWDNPILRSMECLPKCPRPHSLAHITHTWHSVGAPPASPCRRILSGMGRVGLEWHLYGVFVHPTIFPIVQPTIVSQPIGVNVNASNKNNNVIGMYQGCGGSLAHHRAFLGLGPRGAGAN